MQYFKALYNEWLAQMQKEANIKLHIPINLAIAAPDMYETLKELVPESGEWWCPTCKRLVNGEVTFQECHAVCGTFLGDINNQEWLTKARQALAKAEGENPDGNV
jgi:hypothetical protein